MISLRASFAALAVLATNGTSAQTPSTAASTSGAAPAYVSVATLPARPALSTAVREKLAALRPIFDGRTLAGWRQAPLAPFRFAREDVVQPASLARRIAGKSDAVSAFLFHAFDDPGRTALDQLARNETDAREAVTILLRNLNRLTAGPSLHDAERFAHVVLRAETEALRKTQPSDLRLARLNRLLLEDAFPEELPRSPDSGWIVKGGAMASTGASRGSIYTEADYTHYRLVFQVRQITGNHVPGVLIFCRRPTTHDDLVEAQAGVDALGAIQFQVPNGGHWDYRPGFNQAGTGFARPVRVRFNLQEWAQVELLVNARTGVARMAVAQPVGTRGIENLRFHDPAAGRTGPIALQMHNAGLFDEFRDLRIEIDPPEDRLLIVE